MLVLLLFVGVKNHIYKEQQLINIFFEIASIFFCDISLFHLKVKELSILITNNR